MRRRRDVAARQVRRRRINYLVSGFKLGIEGFNQSEPYPVKGRR